ncbi:MAG: PSD1 and planctomycete cytochrome C domain-containing protein [Planctomycetaceae bacterium]
MFMRLITAQRLAIVTGLIICLSSTCIAQPAGKISLGNWKQASSNARQFFVIRGSLNRESPLRAPVEPPISQNEFYISYSLSYPTEDIDQASTDSGEFFILWLDDIEGNESSAHSNQNPNIGIHVDTDLKNKYMIRFSSAKQTFAGELIGDKTTKLVARVSKSKATVDSPFDTIDLWTNPALVQRDKPDCHLTIEGARVSTIRWLGFSTGGKTETTDEITVGDLQIVSSWEELFGIRKQTQVTAPTPLTKPKPTISFVNDVVPILEKRCFQCHQGENDTGLRLDVADQVLNQTTPFAAKQSELIHRIVASNDTKMPPQGARLTGREVEIFSAWINEGMRWDESLFPTPKLTSKHWSFQPIQRPEIPAMPEHGRTVIDAFLAKQQAALDVTANETANMTTLVRRMHLTVTGLPPSAETIQASRKVKTTNKHTWLDQQIQQLLQTKEYGEHWGRYWLDVARWAESNGHQHNRFRPDAWRYRDYVITSFTQNKRFDQFLKEQLAGDELSTDDTHIVATGFLSAARYSGNNLDKQIQRNDILVDVTNTTASAFLGLSMECAQCHTHKFDPLSIRDYYRFQAFFANGQPGSVVLSKGREQAPQLIAEYWNIFDATKRRVYQELKRQGNSEPINVAPETVNRRIAATDRSFYDETKREIDKLPKAWGWYSTHSDYLSLPVAPHLMRWPLERERTALYEKTTHILIRGDVTNPGPEVKPGIPSVFHPIAIEEKPRLALADWMTAPNNPLTARVWVNRIWQGHFGKGIVATSSDFGTQGARPTNLELLDYLASELQSSGWNTNHIHQLILNSHAYRQSATLQEAAFENDPANLSWWGWNPYRLNSEAVRDAILLASNRLVSSTGGPSQKPNTTSRVRSVYIEHRRNTPIYLNEVFDGPDASHSCSRRSQSISPLQSLYLLNSELTNQSALEIADTIKASVDSQEKRAAAAVNAILGRDILPDEEVAVIEFLKTADLRDLCLVLLNSNEFIHVN